MCGAALPSPRTPSNIKLENCGNYMTKNNAPTSQTERNGSSYIESARGFLLRPEATALSAVVVLFVIFTLLAPDLFPTKLTFISIMAIAAELGIVSIGVTLLLIGGHFDLSVGAVLGLSSYVAIALMNDLGISPYFAAPAAVMVGAMLGAINGILVVKFKVHSFVVTLGTMLIWRGVVIALTGGFPLMTEIDPTFRALVSDPILFGFRMSLFWFILIGLVASFMLFRTKFGNWIMAQGQNEQAAKNLGVPVDFNTVKLFATCSALAAVAGIIQVSRFSSVDALRGEGIELQAVAITVIGGTILAGGYGSVIGTILGAITFAMIQTGLVLAGAPGFFFKTLTGVIVILAVILSTNVAARLRRSKPAAGYKRDSSASDDAIRSAESEKVVTSDVPSDGESFPDLVVSEPLSGSEVPVLEARSISKSYGSTTALVNVSLKAHRGRVLVLLGDNGAGKSTLIKMLSGTEKPDLGEMIFEGKPVTFNSSADARAHGIATVFQELAVLPLLSLTRNIVLGSEPEKKFGPFKWLDMKKANEIAYDALIKLGVRWERSLSERGASVSGGERQCLAIARASYFGSSVLILDEPTSALAARQAQRVLESIARAREDGYAVVLITHNFRHAFSVADDILVISQGRIAGAFHKSETTIEEVTEIVSRVR